MRDHQGPENPHRRFGKLDRISPSRHRRIVAEKGRLLLTLDTHLLRLRKEDTSRPATDILDRIRITCRSHR
jgi:hypothetical protein